MRYVFDSTYVLSFGVIKSEGCSEYKTILTQMFGFVKDYFERVCGFYVIHKRVFEFYSDFCAIGRK